MFLFPQVKTKHSRTPKTISQIMTTSPTPPANNRILSIDIMRGIFILAMILVNDIAGVSGTPTWMKHVPIDIDGMTFADLVFPGFLFLVGMAIPLSIGRKLDKGAIVSSLLPHIGIRTVSLIVIGLFMVNTYYASPNGIVSKDLWRFIMYLGVFFIWNTSDKIQGKLKTSLQWLGIVILIIMAIIYRGHDLNTAFQMRVSWWGILALIGWSYLIASLTYIFLRKQPIGIMFVMFLLYGLFYACEVGAFPFIDKYLSWARIGPFFGSNTGIVIAGIPLGMIISKDNFISEPIQRIRYAFWYGAGLFLLGYLLYTMKNLSQLFWLSKEIGTPTWALYSSAFSAWIWALLYWIIDVKQWSKWAAPLKPAGSNALFVYILTPFSVALLGVIGQSLGFDFYHYLSGNFWLGLFRSFVLMTLIVWLVALLRKKGFNLKL